MANKKTWTERGGYGSYGKTALKTKAFEATGFENWFAMCERAGKNIIPVCENALAETGGVIAEEMRAGSRVRTGEQIGGIEASEVQVSGNWIETEIGIDTVKHPEAKHAVFQEYGGRNKAADPFIRPALDNNRKTLKATLIRDIKILMNGGG